MKSLICAAAVCTIALSAPTDQTRAAYVSVQRDGGGRLAPPARVTCDPNRLTSFTGSVTSYTRTSGRVFLRMRTDEATNERFTLRFSRKESATKYFLLNGERFSADDLKLIEGARGKLRPRVRATVWVCEDGSTPIVDWRPGERPSGVY